MSALISGTSVAHSEECPSLPVTTASHAICLAKRFVENKKPQWAVSYETKETTDHWLVYYHPASSNVRGGAGDLKIEKSPGTVKLIRGYK